jgi:predicted DNA binding CopG/RHH family protein
MREIYRFTKETVSNQLGAIMTSKKVIINGSAEAWENGELGQSDANVRKTSADIERQIDESLGLQAISIRLPKATIEAYKNIAEIHGVGYQPLMRDAICRWADSEMKALLTGVVQAQREAKAKAKVKATKTDTKEASCAPPMKKAA